MIVTEGFNNADVLDSIIHNSNAQKFFAGLDTQHNQIQYFIKNYGLVMPRKVTLPTRPEDFGRFRTGHSQEFRPQNYVYIPILPQLEKLLNMKDVYDEIRKQKKVVPGCYSFYEDGLNYKSSNFFRDHPKGLQIHIYVDEVQMCCPLGSYSHKIVFVYFSIGNLPPLFRSSFKSINLLSIFYFEQVTQFDYNILLKPIITDLKLLEQGVDFLIEGRTEKIFGTLTAVIADNLASHQVGGFKCGFSSGYRRCRTCMSLDKDIQTKFSDCEHVMRTKEDHARQCASMTVKELKDHFSKLYGLNHDSSFNTLQFYHVVGGLPPDIMHDLQEGVIPLILCLVLLKFLKMKYFDIDALNHIILNID
jgi:hypothetical protein